MRNDNFILTDGRTRRGDSEWSGSRDGEAYAKIIVDFSIRAGEIHLFTYVYMHLFFVFLCREL